MKRSWQAARAMADNSGWGVENQDESIQEVLERKCPFYTRLDRLWGSHPNVTAIHDTESSQMRSQMLPQIETIDDDESDDDYDWSFSVPPLSENSTPKPSTPKPSTPKPSTPGPSRSTTQAPSSLPKHTEKRSDLAKVMKRAFEEKQASRDETATKRVKAEKDIALEKIASEERVARFTIEGQTKHQQMQLDAQANQFQLFKAMMGDVLAACQGQDVTITAERIAAENEERRRRNERNEENEDRRRRIERIAAENEDRRRDERMAAENEARRRRVERNKRKEIIDMVELSDIPDDSHGDESGGDESGGDG